MKKEIILVLCLFFSIFSYIIPNSIADSEYLDESVELSFSFSDESSGQIINSATISIIEGWTGTVIQQEIISSGDIISIMKNHSFRFKFEVEGYEERHLISSVYSSDEIIDVNFISQSESYEFVKEDEVNFSAGEIELTFLNSMSPDSDLNLSWFANYSFSMHMGVDLLPWKYLGLSGQIDYWIGDRDEILQNSEIELFLEWLNHQGWTDTYFGGCCKIDGKFIKTSELVKPKNSWINLELGTWGWNESTLFSVHSGFTGNRLLEIPLQNDMRQLANMRISTPSDWEFRYSPNLDLFEGNPTQFNVNRSFSGIGGTIPITFGENTAPIINPSVIGHTGLSLPLNKNISFDGSNSVDSSHNIGFGPNLNCVWKFESGDLIYEFSQMLVILNLTDLGFISDSNLETSFECTDYQGLTDFWNKSWYLDSKSPNLNTLTGDAECIDNPLENNLLECENLLVEFSQMLNFNLSLEDDSSSELFVYWTSNHIDGWAAEGNEMGIVFWQGQNSNINFIVNNQQHEERELAIWQLNLRASDEVGNDIIKSWNVTVLDGSSPRINMKLNNQFTLVEPYTGIFLGDSINVNLDSSYDDINRIEDVRFLLSLDGEIFADSDEIGWDGVKSAVIPMLEVGVHELIVNATDLSGNSAEEKFQLFVHPPEIIDIISTEILISTDKLVEGENELEFRLVNAGGSDYDIIICIQNKCLDYNGTGSTFEGYGYTNFTLKYDLNETEMLEVNYTFKSGIQKIQFNNSYEFDFENNREGNEIMIISIFTLFLVCICVLLFMKFKQRKKVKV